MWPRGIARRRATPAPTAVVCAHGRPHSRPDRRWRERRRCVLHPRRSRRLEAWPLGVDHDCALIGRADEAGSGGGGGAPACAPRDDAVAGVGDADRARVPRGGGAGAVMKSRTSRSRRSAAASAASAATSPLQNRCADNRKSFGPKKKEEGDGSFVKRLLHATPRNPQLQYTFGSLSDRTLSLFSLTSDLARSTTPPTTADSRTCAVLVYA